MKDIIKQRDTKQRRMVLQAVKKRLDHPTADDIYLDLRSKDDKISKGTVYRNLNILSENEEIMHVIVPGADRYDSSIFNHYHIICVSCGRVIDAPLEYYDAEDEIVAKTTNFKINKHRKVFEGLCPECQCKTF